MSKLRSSPKFLGITILVVVIMSSGCAVPQVAPTIGVEKETVVAVVKETVVVRETVVTPSQAKKPAPRATVVSRSDDRLVINVEGISPDEARACGLTLSFYKGEQLLMEVPLGELEQLLPFESVTAITVRRRFPSMGCEFAPVNFDSGDFIPVTGMKVTLIFAPCKGGYCPFKD